MLNDSLISSDEIFALTSTSCFSAERLRVEEMMDPRGLYHSTKNVAELSCSPRSTLDCVPVGSPTSCVANEEEVLRPLLLEPCERDDQGQKNPVEAEEIFNLAPAASEPRSTDCPKLVLNSRKSCKQIYEKTASHLPAFGPQALRVLRETSDFHYRPTLRQQIQTCWPSWSRQEQYAVFSGRPWAHFVWLALGAMAEENLFVSQFIRGQDDDFFRQVRAYFVVGRGPGLAAYLDYENSQQDSRYARLRKSVLRHPVIIALERRWRDEGVSLAHQSACSQTPDDGRFGKVADALPKWGKKALRLLHDNDPVISPAVIRRAKKKWLSWSRDEQQDFFQERPKAQYIWLAFGTVIEDGFTILELFPRKSDFFRQAYVYFLVGGSDALAAYLDYRKSSRTNRYIRGPVLEHRAVKALAARWQLEGVVLADFSNHASQPPSCQSSLLAPSYPLGSPELSRPAAQKGFRTQPTETVHGRLLPLAEMSPGSGPPAELITTVSPLRVGPDGTCNTTTAVAADPVLLDPSCQPSTRHLLYKKGASNEPVNRPQHSLASVAQTHCMALPTSASNAESLFLPSTLVAQQFISEPLVGPDNGALGYQRGNVEPLQAVAATSKRKARSPEFFPEFLVDTEKTTADDRYKAIAAKLPAFGTAALRVLRETKDFWHRPTLREQTLESFSSWPRTEQQEIFSSRPWAHFAWLALGAMKEDGLSLRPLARGQDRCFFRQMEAYFVTGSGAGLAAYLDHENDGNRQRVGKIRQATLNHPVIHNLARRWYAEGVPLDAEAIALQMPRDSKFEAIARALPEWGNEAMRILRERSDLKSGEIRRKVTRDWYDWPRHEQQILFSARPTVQYVWLALGAMIENDLPQSYWSQNHSYFFRQANVYFFLGGSRALAAFLDLKIRSTIHVKARKQTLEHPTVKALAAKWISMGASLTDFSAD